MIAIVRKSRASFTLVELLVVIAIIGVLTALIVGVAAGALARGRWARIKVEVDNLAGSIEAYKAEHGDYPPDFNDVNAARAHMRKRYPRWSGLDSTWPGGAGVPLLTEAQALVFWLRGHSTNPLNPFDINYPGKAYFDFKQTRLLIPGSSVVADATVDYPVYVPDGGQNVPFVYFNALSYAHTVPHDMSTAPPPNFSLKMPYQTEIKNQTTNFYEWVNPRSFQILSAGPDGDWGNCTPYVVPFASVTRYPSGSGYTRGDQDNATNFCPTSLESARP